ncbi:MAG: excisionase family DNA-binding protein [Flavisolibacter sp.]|nr:excisionase family DNA-binding protein [Flavisolibacter sp.]
MSSTNIRILKNCTFCSQQFVAQKISTQYCSHRCAAKAYKIRMRKSVVAVTEAKEQLVRNTKTVITENDIKVIQAKQYLTLKEAAILLNVAPLTLRRWIFAGRIISNKVGKKHIIDRTAIQKK